MLIIICLNLGRFVHKKHSGSGKVSVFIMLHIKVNANALAGSTFNSWNLVMSYYYTVNWNYRFIQGWKFKQYFLSFYRFIKVSLVKVTFNKLTRNNEHFRFSQTGWITHVINVFTSFFARKRRNRSLIKRAVIWLIHDQIQRELMGNTENFAHYTMILMSLLDHFWLKLEIVGNAKRFSVFELYPKIILKCLQKHCLVCTFRRILHQVSLKSVKKMTNLQLSKINFFRFCNALASKKWCKTQALVTLGKDSSVVGFSVLKHRFSLNYSTYFFDTVSLLLWYILFIFWIDNKDQRIILHTLAPISSVLHSERGR